MAKQILTINGGSSSIKFALFDVDQPPVRVLSGKIDRIGLTDTTLSVTGADKQRATQSIEAATQTAATSALMNWLGQHRGLDAVAAIGHRVVHGGPHYRAPERVTRELVDRLREISPFDPEHLPAEIELIEAFAQHDPDRPQFVCFDTAFH